MQNEEHYEDFDDYPEYDPDYVPLINMADVQTENVRWLWYPYFPSGKVTIVEGDPGEGKTMLTLAIASDLTKGIKPSGEGGITSPINVIYQTAEDGLADTVKPRLEALGADCSRVCVIDESNEQLTLTDSRIERAIHQAGAKLLIIDPLQAYLGSGVDMHRANEVRPILRCIGDVADRTDCAVVIVEHMNKMRGGKAIHRGLGSVDISAAARSIILVGRPKSDSDIRAMAHIKSNLAPAGSTIGFKTDGGFQWLGEIDATAEDIINNLSSDRAPKTQTAKDELIRLLTTNGEMSQKDVMEYFRIIGISERTVNEAKLALNVRSRRKGKQWYWSI